jgi:hypothetical protein
MGVEALNDVSVRPVEQNRVVREGVATEFFFETELLRLRAYPRFWNDGARSTTLIW